MSILKNKEGLYECPICLGLGDIEVHAGGLPWYVTCENCDGVGYCDWVRYAKPILPEQWSDQSWKV